jgi:hypothetical protein
MHLLAPLFLADLYKKHRPHLINNISRLTAWRETAPELAQKGILCDGWTSDPFNSSRSS